MASRSMTGTMPELEPPAVPPSLAKGPGVGPPPDPEAAWTAVLARDARADGRFVYAVSTTRVYCRPTCPSRRPHRTNVVFFSSPEIAEREGFRECLRCRPRSAAASPAVDTVARACARIDAAGDSPLPLDALAREVGLSGSHLQRLFKRVTGITPREYAAARRTERLKTSLKQGDTVSRATYQAGYGSSSRVYEQADRRLGMTPAEYRRGGRGVQIRYALAASSLGRVLVAATERGICTVSLGDSDEPLVAELAREYPHARVEPATGGLGELVAATLRCLEGQPPQPDLPLDLAGTAFQLRVWKALREIPFGTTRTYGQLAASLGQATAARAVASACAANPVAVLVPCHRVVREGGGLGGYRWGVERKRRLLQRERQEGDDEAMVPGTTTQRLPV